MGKYMYMFLGVILGIAVSLYFYSIKRERYEKRIRKDQKLFSTERLDNALEKAVNEMQEKMKNIGRALTEEEKNEVIFKFLNEKENKSDLTK